MNESDTLSAQSIEGQLANAKLNEKNIKRELEEAHEEIQNIKTQMVLKDNEIKKLKSRASKAGGECLGDDPSLAEFLGDEMKDSETNSYLKETNKELEDELNALHEEKLLLEQDLLAI